MEQEITRPDAPPRGASQATSTFACLLAASGVTLLTAVMLGAGLGATVWAFSKLFGFPETVMWVIMGLSAIPVLWAAGWTAGRAWHVERRLQAGLDIDTPVFKLTHYWRKA